MRHRSRCPFWPVVETDLLIVSRDHYINYNLKVVLKWDQTTERNKMLALSPYSQDYKPLSCTKKNIFRTISIPKYGHCLLCLFLKISIYVYALTLITLILFCVCVYNSSKLCYGNFNAFNATWQSYFTVIPFTMDTFFVCGLVKKFPNFCDFFLYTPYIHVFHPMK